MAKAIDNSKTWYQEVSPRSYYIENDLERDVMHNLEIIFPQFAALLFKKPLLDSVTTLSKTPDLAMVKSDYSEWYIIEVELGKHHKSHVVEQIKAFYNCGYKDEHAAYIYTQRPDLDIDQLKDMVSKITPNFMVIVNENKPEWVPELKKLRCKTCVFQIYHDFNGNALHRINGEHPYIYTKFSHCKYQKTLPYAIEVLEVAFLSSYGVNNADKLNIEYNGKNIQWERKDSGKQVYLICKNDTPPLDPLTPRYRLNYNDALTSFSFTKD
jgi:hypothetical protein